MANKKLKKIMTDLAAGHISKKEADRLLKLLKTPQNQPNGKKDTHKRRKQLNKKGGK